MTQTFELVPGQGVAPVALGMARDADPEGNDDEEYGGAFAAFGLGVEGSFDR